MRKAHPHPGRYLRQLLRGYGVTWRQFSIHTGLEEPRINRMCRGIGPTSGTDAAVILEAALGISAEFWVTNQALWRLDHERPYLPFRRIERLPKTDDVDTLPTAFDRCLCGHWGWEHDDDGPCLEKRCACAGYSRLGKTLQKIDKKLRIRTEEDYE